MLSKPKNKQAGFTLIELVVVILLTGILVAAVTPFVQTNVEAFMRIQQGKNLAQGTRVGLLRMIEELKRATSINSGDSNDIQFTFVDSDGNSHTYTYEYLSDKQSLVKRKSFLSKEPLIVFVQSFSLTYFNAGGATTNATSARRIQIVMKVGPTSDQAATINTQVTLRNMF